MGMVALGIGTVSYTHLDVYKRQASYSKYWRNRFFTWQEPAHSLMIQHLYTC